MYELFDNHRGYLLSIIFQEYSVCIEEHSEEPRKIMSFRIVFDALDSKGEKNKNQKKINIYIWRSFDFIMFTSYNYGTGDRNLYRLKRWRGGKKYSQTWCQMKRQLMHKPSRGGGKTGIASLSTKWWMKLTGIPTSHPRTLVKYVSLELLSSVQLLLNCVKEWMIDSDLNGSENTADNLSITDTFIALCTVQNEF